MLVVQAQGKCSAQTLSTGSRRTCVVHSGNHGFFFFLFILSINLEQLSISHWAKCFGKGIHLFLLQVFWCTHSAWYAWSRALRFWGQKEQRFIQCHRCHRGFIRRGFSPLLLPFRATPGRFSKPCICGSQGAGTVTQNRNSAGREGRGRFRSFVIVATKLLNPIKDTRPRRERTTKITPPAPQLLFLPLPCTRYCSSQQLHAVGTALSMSPVKKLRPREAKSLMQCYTAW